MSRLSKLISRRISIPAEGVADEVAHFDVVSFDIFDTLVKRNVRRPEDVFALLERELCGRLGGDAFRGLADERVAAERKAREAKGDEEVTLSDIYAQTSFDEASASSAMCAECELEERLCVPNAPLVEAFRSCLARGQRVVVISDIYLPRGTVEAILSKCGLAGYERLFLSCEGGATKRTGRLFKEAFAELGVEAGRVVHVGDSLVSDWRSPRRLGAHAVLIARDVVPGEFARPLAERGTVDAGMVSAAIENRRPRGSNYYLFGYEAFGSYLLGFSKWLKSKLDTRGIGSVFFLSRDGYVLKRAFETVYPDCSHGCEYLEVSRRSLRVPMLRVLKTLQEVIDVMPPSRVVSVAEIFDTLGLAVEGHEELLSGLGLEAGQTFERSELASDPRIASLVEALRPEYERLSEEQYEALRAYLDRAGVGGRFAIVDIGWSGGMQRYLESALSRMGIGCEVSGYYTGVVAYAARNVKYGALDLNGYVFDCLRDGAGADPRRFYVGFLETLFLEQDGTVVGYEIGRDGVPRAARAPYEYRSSDGGLMDEAEHVRELQDGALAFLRDARESGVAEMVEITPEEAFCGIDEAGASPSGHVLDMFAGFRFFDDGAVGRLACPKGLGHYLAHPAELKRDLLGSRWKVAFAKRLLHGLPLPYRRILSRLAKGGE